MLCWFCSIRYFLTAKQSVTFDCNILLFTRIAQRSRRLKTITFATMQIYSSRTQQDNSKPTVTRNSKVTPLKHASGSLIDDGSQKENLKFEVLGSEPGLVKTVSDDASETFTKHSSDTASPAPKKANCQSPIWVYYPPKGRFHLNGGDFFPRFLVEFT
jgi:hypothetical protein